MQIRSVPLWLVSGGENGYPGLVENECFCLFVFGPHLIREPTFVFAGKSGAFSLFCFVLLVAKWAEKSRQFLVDTLTLVAVALGQRFFSRNKRGLEGVARGPVLEDRSVFWPVGVVFVEQPR